MSVERVKNPTVLLRRSLTAYRRGYRHYLTEVENARHQLDLALTTAEKINKRVEEAFAKKLVQS